MGLDLAWGERNLTGFAVLEWDERRRGLRLTDSALVHTDADIVKAVEHAQGEGDCLLAIDAPIIAPNEAGTMRPCDRAVTSDFGRFHAGTYPANRERCARPIRLRKRLQRAGYSPDPELGVTGRCLHQLEIFPHPAHVVLFHRQRIIKYKKGTVAQKRAGLAELIDGVAHYLPRTQPPLLTSPQLSALVATDVAKLRGRTLKGFEDRVDALLCAFMAAYFWHWREERCRVYGDVKTGYIICPRIE